METWPVVVLENCTAFHGHHGQDLDTNLIHQPQPVVKLEALRAAKKRRRSRRLFFKRRKYFYVKEAVPIMSFCGWSCGERTESLDGEEDFLGFNDHDTLSSHIISAQHPAWEGEDLLRH
ncbi:uncharacterized protein LOC117643006 [Thrips palmi]|uniref:Uncharacterized protein LOC117643006 n=1 Tax=Thrips palmi TaxID=161013 RepID=A0A6P8YTX5_THRPL|nr:uncharacterized protein LOC117643006 [Thrips palmi]